LSGGNSTVVEPYLTIMFQTRSAIRRVIETDPRRHVLALAAVSTALAALQIAWSSVISGQYEPGARWPETVVALVVAAAIGGILLLYFNAWLVRITGVWLGGVATSLELRAALAWSRVPIILASAVSIAAVLAEVNSVRPAPLLDLSPGHLATSAVAAILDTWGAIVVFKCVGEVHGFSAWRALGALLLAGLLALIIIGVLATAAMIAYYAMKPG